MNVPRHNKASLKIFIPPVAILLLATMFILLAPSEAIIGDGLKIVVIHVSLIWTGMLGLVLTGIISMVIIAWQDDRLSSWMECVAWVSLVVFALGVGANLIAEIVNWGGIAWNEPQKAANLNLLALAIIIQVIANWLGRKWLQGVLHPVVAVVWVTVTTELQLHPSGAVSSSASGNIRFTF